MGKEAGRRAARPWARRMSSPTRCGSCAAAEATRPHGPAGWVAWSGVAGGGAGGAAWAAVRLKGPPSDGRSATVATNVHSRCGSGTVAFGPSCSKAMASSSGAKADVPSVHVLKRPSSAATAAARRPYTNATPVQSSREVELGRTAMVAQYWYRQVIKAQSNGPHLKWRAAEVWAWPRGIGGGSRVPAA
eukprot:scaffold59_cov119-Isochrysis_galbana.AAC.4